MCPLDKNTFAKATALLFIAAFIALPLCFFIAVQEKIPL